jgi:hypothetical protein
MIRQSQDSKRIAVSDLGGLKELGEIVDLVIEVLA